MSFKKHIAIFLLFFTTYVTAQKAKFVAPDVGTSIKVLKQNVESMWTGYNASGYGITSSYWVQSNEIFSEIYKPDTAFVGIDSGYYKCNTDYSLLFLENSRFENNTELVYTSGLNINKKRFKLSPLKPLIKHQKNDAFIKMENVSITVNRGSFKQIYYESYNEYKKKDTDHVFTSEKEIYIKNTLLWKDLNKYLKRTGYLDTTNKLNFTNFKEIGLEMEVIAITEHKFGYYCVTEVTTLVNFPMSFGHLKEKSYTTRSYIGFDFSKQDHSNNRELVADALKNVIGEILKDEEVNYRFLNQQAELKKMTNWGETINLRNKLQDASNLENSTNAVVTVQQIDGHGSGCVISNDGYIVTNFHVVGKDTSDIYLIFNSGLKKRCRFVRGNPEYDLSLLKIDSAFVNPLKVNQQKLISVGADVYAIGTPNDVRLGQTITKGIISAKRVMDEKLYIQSDASVNKGNSGGALTNKDGELIGIVNAKLIGVGIEGVSFSIPAYYIEEALMVKINP